MPAVNVLIKKRAWSRISTAESVWPVRGLIRHEQPEACFLCDISKMSIMAYLTINKGTSDELNLFYREQGVGEPVVFIHGWPLTSATWEDSFYALSENYRCIAYDRRGFGQSDKPGSGYDYNTMAADLHGLLEGLDLTGVTLVGFSMGGGEVARYLGKYGDKRIKKAVMVSAVPPLLLKSDKNPDGVAQSVFDGMKEQLKEDRPAFLAEFSRNFYGKKVSDEMISWSCSLAMQASLKATIDCVTAFSSTDFSNDLKKIKVPTLIIHGDADQIVPIEISGEKMSEEISHSSYSVYKGAPHGLIQTNKEDFISDLKNFLAAEVQQEKREATVL